MTSNVSKILRFIDIYDRDFKFYVSKGSNTYKSSFGGILTIFYTVSFIFAIIYSYSKYKNQSPKFFIIEDLANMTDYTGPLTYNDS